MTIRIDQHGAHLPLLLSFLFSTTAWADGTLHKSPWNFLFDNHLDTHQEAKWKEDGSLKGKLFVYFTGDTDAISGLPIARHPRGASHAETCGVDPIDCVVGWNFVAVAGEAKFLFHSGVNGDDHPVWLVNRVDIPQPGPTSHFHWIGSSSSDSRATEVPAVCDQTTASGLESAGAANTVCPGWFIELTAIQEFAFEHGGELIPVQPGADMRSHLNLLTNYAEVPGITPTRGSDGH